MSNPTELPDLDKLEALARAATPGPWMRLWDERTVYDRMEDGCRGNAIVRADMGYSATDAGNLDFIAAANPAAVLALIALARRAQPEGEARDIARRLAAFQKDGCMTSWGNTTSGLRDPRPEGEAPQAVHQMRNRVKGGPWQETDADGVTCLKRMPHWADLYEFRTLYTAPTAQHAESGAPDIEAAAKAIHGLFTFGHAAAWVNGGSDSMQELARRYARAALAAQSQGAKAPVPREFSIAMEDLHKVVNTIAERLDGDGRTAMARRLQDAAVDVDLASRAALAAKAEAPKPRIIGGQRWSKEAEITEAHIAAQQAAAPGAVHITPQEAAAAGIECGDTACGGCNAGEPWCIHSAPGTPEAPADKVRLDFMAQRSAWIAWDREGERCRLFVRDEDGDTGPMMGWITEAWADSARDAIDKARAAQLDGGQGEGA